MRNVSGNINVVVTDALAAASGRRRHPILSERGNTNLAPTQHAVPAARMLRAHIISLVKSRSVLQIALGTNILDKGPLHECEEIVPGQLRRTGSS